MASKGSATPGIGVVSSRPKLPPRLAMYARAVAVLAFLVPVIGGSMITTEAEHRATATASAQPFADLELPRIAVTITNDAFEGVPASLPAGRYLLSVTNAFHASTEETAGAVFLRLPDDLGANEFIASVHEAGGDWPADWYYATALAGGPYANRGATAYAVIDLTAGEWVLWGEAPGAPQRPVPVTVTGTPPADLPAPTADITVELTEFDIDFDASLRPGHQVIEVVNAGERPHFLFIGGVADGTTVAEAQAAFEAFWNPETAPPAAFSFADSPELLGTGDQSPGTTAWYGVDLPAGTVVVACFVTDPETGQPHAMLGMTEIVEIG